AATRDLAAVVLVPSRVLLSARRVWSLPSSCRIPATWTLGVADGLVFRGVTETRYGSWSVRRHGGASKSPWDAASVLGLEHSGPPGPYRYESPESALRLP